MLKQLDMVAVRVHDWERALDWYEQTLGLAVYHREDEDRFAVLGLPDGGATLTLVGEHPVTLETDNRVIPCFSVDDLDKTIAELEAKGVAIEDKQDGHDEAYRLVRIRDPEGNLIQLYWTAPD